MPLRFLISNFWKYYSDKTLLAASMAGLVLVFALSDHQKQLTLLVILSMIAIALVITLFSYVSTRRQGKEGVEDCDIATIYLCKYRKFWKFFRVYTIVTSSRSHSPKRRIRLSRGENNFSCFMKHKNGYYYPYAGHWSSLDIYQSGEIEMFGKWGTLRRIELNVNASKHSAQLHELGVHTAITQNVSQFYAHPVGKSATVGVHEDLY